MSAMAREAAWLRQFPVEQAPAAELARVLPTKVRDELARRAREVVLERARASAAGFAAYVLRDEETGRPIRLAPMHRRWHALADQHRRLVFISHVEAGKTQQLSIARTLYALGKAPSTRAVIVSRTDPQAQKIVRTLGQYITRSKELQATFPGLKPSPHKDDTWSAHSLTVERPTIAKDPSVQACGTHGAITGARIDLLVLDDILDYENTRTAHRRQDADSWVRSELFSRLTPDAVVLYVANAWHPQDLGHVLETEGWPTYRFPVLDEAGAISWPERWSLERIAERAKEFGPYEADRKLRCKAIDPATSRLRPEWIVVEKPPAVAELGIGWGMDLAWSKRSSSDWNAVVVVGRDAKGITWVLDVDRVQGSGPEAEQMLDRMAARWPAAAVIVEDVNAQRLAVWALARASKLPITGSGPLSKGDKVSRFVPLEFRYRDGLMRHAPGLPDWFRQELLAFPDGAHDDMVDALVYAFHAAPAPADKPKPSTDDRADELERRIAIRHRERAERPWYDR